MEAQAYIMSQLERLKAPTLLVDSPKGEAEVIEFIYDYIMTRRFRKNKIPDINKTTTRQIIELNVKKNAPIQFVFPFGGYKLWRLEETPEPDWAELFTLMYYAELLKPICAVYKPGVHFTFWSDEVAVKKLNNIPEADTQAYAKKFNQVIAFLEHYVPSNLKFELFPERSRYKDYAEFESLLTIEMDKLRDERAKNPIPLSDTAIGSIDLNVKLQPGQTDDPQWREKNDLIHISYYILRATHEHARRIYAPENIVAFPMLFGNPKVIPIGTTKTSAAKFWVGVGALLKREDGFIETVLSPSQLEKTNAKWESVTIKGLEGKNFKKVRVVE